MSFRIPNLKGLKSFVSRQEATWTSRMESLLGAFHFSCDDTNLEANQAGNFRHHPLLARLGDVSRDASDGDCGDIKHQSLAVSQRM